MGVHLREMSILERCLFETYPFWKVFYLRDMFLLEWCSFYGGEGLREVIVLLLEVSAKVSEVNTETDSVHPPYTIGLLVYLMIFSRKRRKQVLK